MSQLADISPGHLPVVVAREALERSKTARAIAVVIIDGDESESLWYECCGYEKQAVLWALKKMEKKLLEDDGP